MFSRPLEAQADDPLKAMQDILSKLETWRASSAIGPEFDA